MDATDDDFLMDKRQLAGVITARTRAIIPVHLYGKPAPMDPILQLADAQRLLVIEDAAQAHGASIASKRVGSFGACGCFSFHPSKNLAAAGDAGAIVTNSRLGQRRQNEHSLVGLNTKLDGLQAAVLSDKLPKLDTWNAARAQVADWYRQDLQGCPVSFQGLSHDTVQVYHLLPVRTPRRDAMLSFLRAEGVDAVVRYPTPIHLQPAFENYGWQSGQFPVSESLARELLCLPIRPDMQRFEVAYVTERIKKFVANRANAA